MPDEITPPVTETAVAIAPRYPMREMLTILKDTGDAELFQAFARDIIEREVAAARFGQDTQLARVFAHSGAFDGVDGSDRGVALAMTKIQLGRSWNMDAADAMESVFFINGRPSVSTRYLSAKMRDSGLDWDIEWDEVDGVCTGCHLHLKRWNAEAKRFDPIMGRVNGVDKQAVVSFTKKDADRAEITQNGKTIKLSEKWNFKSWPRDMYFARCISRVRTQYASNILSGVMTREEADDISTEAPPLMLQAATATQAKQNALGAKVRAAKAVTEMPTPVVATAPPEPDPPIVPASPTPHAAPWTDQDSMKAAMRAHRERLGSPAFDKHCGDCDVMIGTLKFDDPRALKLYNTLVADDGSVF